jgi:hypothetical protein
MAEASETTLTGGCQCGAVRYRLHQIPTEPSICHCRMCQKAFGSFFAPLAGVQLDKFEVTRGKLSIFKSSDIVERGFCRDCGTPLSFRYLAKNRISVSIGSLDEPHRVKPIVQDGIEGRLPYFTELVALPENPPTEVDDPDMAAAARRSNHQHPDHDTAEWPPRQ